MGYKRKETDNMENLLTNGKKKFVKYDEGAAMFSMGIHVTLKKRMPWQLIIWVHCIMVVVSEENRITKKPLP